MVPDLPKPVWMPRRDTAQALSFPEMEGTCEKLPASQERLEPPSGLFSDMPCCRKHTQLRVEDAAKHFEALSVPAGPVQNMERLFARIKQYLIRSALARASRKVDKGASCGSATTMTKRKARHALRSSANTVSWKRLCTNARRTSAKHTIQKSGPRTVPWNTLSASSLAGDAAPPSTTCELRSASQPARKPTRSGCKPFVATFFVSFVLQTLSNAPRTSEQKTPTAKTCSISSSQEHTSTARTSL